MDNKLKDRLARLRAMAEDTGSEAEATIALRRLHSLLAKHNLSLVDLDEDPEAPRQDSFVDHNRPWKKIVASAVCRLYFCELYLDKVDKKKSAYVITGKDHNREFALFIIENTMRAIGAEALRQSKEIYGERNVPFINSFKNGAANRIGRRCRDMIRSACEGTLENSDGPGTLPAMLNVYDRESSSNKEFLSLSGVRLKSSATRGKSTDPRGFAKGQEAGNNVQLSRAIHNDLSPKLIN